MLNWSNYFKFLILKLKLIRALSCLNYLKQRIDRIIFNSSFQNRNFVKSYDLTAIASRAQLRFICTQSSETFLHTRGWSPAITARHTPSGSWKPPAKIVFPKLLTKRAEIFLWAPLQPQIKASSAQTKMLFE